MLSQWWIQTHKGGMLQNLELWLENKKRFKDTNSKTTKKEDCKAKAHMMECKEDITNVEPGNKGGNISLNSFNVLGAFNSKLKKTKQEENKI